MGRIPKLYPYNGGAYTVKQIASMTGNEESTIYKYIRMGKEIKCKDPDMAGNRHTPVKYTSNGETHTAKEWADITGLHRETIYRYIRAGLPLETHSMKCRKKYKPPFKVKDYHFPEIGDEDTMAIACAVVQQAADDWHYLCNGGEETQDCNFVELTDFFENELTVFGLSKKTAQEVWEIMQKEREGMT